MVNHIISYKGRREVKPMYRFIQNLTETVKELQKLVAQLEKLVIGVVSIVGWIYILIKLFE